MTLKVRRGRGREFEVPNGNHTGYDNLKEVLRGHPAGISSLHVDDEDVYITVSRPMETISPNTGRLNNPVRVGKIKGDVEVDFGQRYEATSHGLVVVSLFSGASAELTSQDETFELTHIPK